MNTLRYIIVDCIDETVFGTSDEFLATALSAELDLIVFDSLERVQILPDGPKPIPAASDVGYEC